MRDTAHGGHGKGPHEHPFGEFLFALLAVYILILFIQACLETLGH